MAIALTLNPSSLPRAMLLTAHLVDEIAFHRYEQYFAPRKPTST